MESWHPLFRNLKRELPLSKLFCSESTLSVRNVHVRRYLNYLMDEYQNKDNCEDGISEIFKFHEIPPLLNEKIKMTENIKNLNDLGKQGIFISSLDWRLMA